MGDIGMGVGVVPTETGKRQNVNEKHEGIIP